MGVSVWTNEARPSREGGGIAEARISDTFDHDGLSDLLMMMGVPASDSSIPADLSIPTRNLVAGEALFHQGAEMQAIYVVRSGMFKTFRTAEDGYEQVMGFASRAEVLGFDALCAVRHPIAAAALEDSSVYVILLRDFSEIVRSSPALGIALHRAVSSALAYQAELTQVMTALAAEVRLARFLCQLSRQLEVRGQPADQILLRMSRRDIASYLGVAHETVSRSFSALADLGYVNVQNRRIDILDQAGLKAFARSRMGRGSQG
jgi:CRP/FNR family transcriptional regulator